ncbi:MAG: AAA family ATPase [Calothrix sp. FI2-JRJ7]|jgi:predicted ATPase/signal transduction histidine kinase|nr:AAA family ATPase [Calothrix sp. FI2-JRJ7]
MVTAAIKIPGYSISERIYVGTRTIVYQAVREQDQAPVAIKLMRNPDPSFDEIVYFRNQYTIAANLNIPGIVQPYSLEIYGNGYALIMEFGGISLKDWLASTQLSIPDFLSTAIQITTVLDQLHRNRVIHKDIKPANILINPDTQQIKITDFSISSLLLRETQQLQRNILEGTLAYISPEQTGRINRGVDYRSDFYSLGVTFYELLTGQLPFTSNEPSELVHSHITKQPVAVDAINKNIPKVLAVIVSKLMAKNPEERYQSALGLKYDLEACLNLYHSNEGASNTIFPLGTKDISDRFLIPDKLYGRDTEVTTLLQAFARVSTTGVEILLLRGFSGTGKTALVKEVQKPITQHHGYFIKGKYDQFARNVPLFGIIQAFSDLIEQLLTQSESQILKWKNLILDAVGDNGQVIIDVIPEVELLIGKQPPSTELDLTAAQNRFNLVFKKFIRVFCSAEHPLVIFLDDLQWADTASLQLIHLFAVELEYLLLIGAYRDNEVNSTHRLMSTIDDIQNAGATIETITLNALSFDAVNQLVADTLLCNTDKTYSLTQYIYSKTQGNSFFTRELLNTLYTERVIYFDYEKSIWQWDESAAHNLPLSNDILEFIVLKLLSLPTATQDILKLAACIGNQFDLEILSTVSDIDAAALWKAIQEGLILTTSQVYKYYQSKADGMLIDNNEQLTFRFQFLHDRVQQAAYALISEADKKSVHLKIGRLLLKSIVPASREERIFEIVNQLNYGVELITHQVERDELAQLNLIACRKARSTTAYSAAREYAKEGIKLLGEDSWQRYYEVTLALHELGTEIAYLCGELEQMEYFINQVTHNAHVLLHQIKVHEIKIQAYISQNRFADAISTALFILKRFGIEFTELPTPEDFQQAMAEVATYISENSINDLSVLAPMQSQDMLAAMRILSSVASAAYISSSPLYSLIIFKQVSISVQYGNAPCSAYAYATYGLILCAFGNDIEAGYRCGNAALKLLPQASEFKAKVINLVYSFVLVWKTHLQKNIQPLLEGYHNGLETGDLEFGAYCAFNYCNLSYWSGKNLATLVDEIDLYNSAMRQTKQESARNFQRIFYQAALNLTTNNTNPIAFNGEVYNELEMLPVHTSVGDSYSLGTLYLHKLMLCVLFGENRQGVESSILAQQYAGAIAGTYYSALIPFYSSLCQLGIYSKQTAEEQQIILTQVKQNQDKIKNWANHAPMNHLHKWYLVEAEQYRVLNNKVEAIECYDKAIALAQENGYINEEALCWELAAKFYLEWGKKIIAQTYMVKAYEAYQHWGAKTKLTHLMSNYPQLLTSLQSTISPIKTDKFTTISTHSTTATEYLDFKAILKASQSLSSEIQLDNLISTLMQVVLENAGADKGVLLLLKNNILGVAAHSHDEINVLLPDNLINYARYAKKSVIINDVGASTEWKEDGYFEKLHPQSVLCTPIINKSRLVGVLYLENNLIREAFTTDRVEILNLLCSQAAISLENATLYQTSQNYAIKLEQNLQEQKIQALELQQTLEELQEAQTQLVQNEKMSALGNLVAGVAHEINNPVGFIAGNIQPALNFVNDIFGLLDLYQQKFSDPGAEISEEIETIDLDYIRQDLPKLLSSMKEGVQRIRSISNSLRTFSRADTETKIPFDIHDGINSTIMILSHRLKANEHRPQIQIVKTYAKLPQILCFPGQLNQVLMNLFANAIDALEESNTERSFEEIQLNPNCITVKTSLSTDAQKVIIYIKDNGKGMSEEVKQRIFDKLFTTKAVGKGTGLGLAIARQIIIEKHGGNIKVNSTPGEGAEFIIEIPVD